MKKVIIIASAVIAVLYSVYLTICTVYTLVEALRYGLYEYHALDRGPAGNFATSIIMELLILFVSILVLFKVRPPKLLRILIVIFAVIIVLLSILTAGIYTFVVIKGSTYRTINAEYIVFILGQSAVIITLLTYIRRALKPAKK